jgi:hypothetical protein
MGSFEEIIEEPHLNLIEGKVVTISGGKQAAQFLIAFLGKTGFHVLSCIGEYVVKVSAHMLSSALATSIQ